MIDPYVIVRKWAVATAISGAFAVLFVFFLSRFVSKSWTPAICAAVTFLVFNPVPLPQLGAPLIPDWTFLFGTEPFYGLLAMPAGAPWAYAAYRGSKRLITRG